MLPALGALRRAARDLFSLHHLRKGSKDLVTSRWFTHFILGVVIINTALIGVQTDTRVDMAAGWHQALVDAAFNGIYIGEIGIKLFVYQRRFFDSKWNIFDMAVVGVSMLDYLKLLLANFAIDPTIFRLLRLFRALRALRALRVLRTIAFFKSLQVIVHTVLRSIPALGSIVMLLLLLLYVFAIIGRSLYGEVYPQRFGNIWLAAFSLFQMLTLDDWYSFYTDMRQTKPSILIYLVVFIIIETFIFMNLFIAVIVNNLQINQRKYHREKRESEKRKSTKSAGASVTVEAAPSAGEEGGKLKKPGGGDSLRGPALTPASSIRRATYTPLEAREKGSMLLPDMPLWQRELHEQILEQLASVEAKAKVCRNQQLAMDDLVDMMLLEDGP
eukprot:jgi/Mesvir1/28573/Mv00989-RA.1